MPLTYTNRQGKTHYFRAVPTVKGSIRYYITKSTNFSDLIEEVPNGFEIYEDPQEARVVLRKIIPCLVTEQEIEIVRKAIEQYSDLKDFFVQGEGSELLIWVSQFNSIEGFEENLTRKETIELHNERVTTWMRYFNNFRFALLDEKERTFVAVRIVNTGLFDNNFIPLKGGRGDLKRLTKKFCVFMGRNTYFDTIPEGFVN